MKISNVLPQFCSVQDVISALRPDYPVHCLRSDLVTQAARAFVDGFPGETLFAVKCNAHPQILRLLNAAGIHHFDVASDFEIALVRELCPGATQYYHHPAKTAASIRAA